MIGILRFRRKHGSMPQFEEAIARLSDELALTEAFADKMIRDGHYKAAAGVVAEQESRMAMHHQAMASAFRPHHRRVQVALGGLAAAMILGSASFAFVGSRGSADQSAHEVIHSVEKNLQNAASARTDAEASTFVTAALGDLAALGEQLGVDVATRERAGDSIERQLSLLLQARPQMASLARKILEAARAAQVEVSAPSASPTPAPSVDASHTPKPQPSNSAPPSGPPAPEPTPPPTP